ncbi:hypothetical protein CVIRNUC_008730 [Coccomyxa viridis]|uniref:Uncharacterized protein n=1 Tax=Coccomyxa viridis TaxID=1274662 RepID=A0AAV1IH34_9CHLO|nr:hypothetical protein CVIRNUC_008730 [Coccomyxa viridis]
MVQTRHQAKRAKLAPAEPEPKPKPEERPGAAARSLRQAFLVERLLCEADAAEVAMSGVQMIRDNTQTCLNNLERSLDRCNSFLTHRCIPKECVLATADMLNEFGRELDALRQREERIMKLCMRQQATVNLKNREFTEAVVNLIQQCLQ